MRLKMRNLGFTSLHRSIPAPTHNLVNYLTNVEEIRQFIMNPHLPENREGSFYQMSSSQNQFYSQIYTVFMLYIEVIISNSWF